MFALLVMSVLLMFVVAVSNVCGTAPDTYRAADRHHHRRDRREPQPRGFLCVSSVMAARFRQRFRMAVGPDRHHGIQRTVALSNRHHRGHLPLWRDWARVRVGAAAARLTAVHVFFRLPLVAAFLAHFAINRAQFPQTRVDARLLVKIAIAAFLCQDQLFDCAPNIA
jgi:hypothetical protein